MRGHRPKLGVSALRFCMRVLQISGNNSEDAAVEIVNALFEEYGRMLSVDVAAAFVKPIRAIYSECS